MRSILKSLFFGSNNLITGAVALAVVLSIALGCNCNKDFNLGNTTSSSNDTRPSNDDRTDTDASTSGVPSESVVEGLVKETLSDFAEAVDSGDFSDLHAKASQDFQSSYTVDQMKTAFKSYTDKKRVVMPIFNRVETTSAKFTTPPGLRTEQNLKILMAKGEFPTKPFKVRYDFEYVYRGGEWKLLKLIVNVP